MITLDGKVVLITGGTGSWGRELVIQLLRKFPNVEQIRIFSRNEHQQVSMRAELNEDSRVVFIVGDIRDFDAVKNATEGVSAVFHLAALKNVQVCEENPWEANLTNINGTRNVILAARQCGVMRVVHVSTDKAVEPFNHYGTTKKNGEKLMIDANFDASRKGITRFIVVRSGNLLSTNGSVLPTFINQLKMNNRLTLTDGSNTRFFIRKQAAVGLLIEVLNVGIGGEIFIMRMPATKILSLAEAVINVYGNEFSKMEIIGMRDGDKPHEVLISRVEAPLTREFSNEFFVIVPRRHSPDLEAAYGALKHIDLEEFGSRDTQKLTVADWEKLLHHEDSEKLD